MSRMAVASLENNIYISNWWWVLKNMTDMYFNFTEKYLLFLLTNHGSTFM